MCRENKVCRHIEMWRFAPQAAVFRSLGSSVCLPTRGTLGIMPDSTNLNRVPSLPGFWFPWLLFFLSIRQFIFPCTPWAVIHSYPVQSRMCSLPKFTWGGVWLLKEGILVCFRLYSRSLRASSRHNALNLIRIWSPSLSSRIHNISAMKNVNTSIFTLLRFLDTLCITILQHTRTEISHLIITCTDGMHVEAQKHFRIALVAILMLPNTLLCT